MGFILKVKNKNGIEVEGLYIGYPKSPKNIMMYNGDNWLKIN